MEFDPKKNKTNRRKHGITFEESAEVFNDPNALEFYDEANSSIDEDRYICIGDVGNFLIVTLAYTDRNGNVRIITARPAEPIEEKAYYENLKRTFGRN